MLPSSRLGTAGAAVLAASSLAALLLALGCSSGRSSSGDDTRFRGICFVAGGPVETAHFAALSRSGVRWISQTPFGWQDRVDDPEFRIVTSGRIYWGERDEGLVETARLARAEDIHTLLKPHLWLRDRTGGKWEGDIAMRSEEDWATWFACYERFLLHYARLAEDADIEVLCVGAELQGTTHREAEWRHLIARTREVYRGQLTYAANWSGEFEKIAFWDALDYAGVQAYFPLSEKDDPPLEELLAGWRPHRDRLAAFAARVKRPVLFTEVGYRNALAAAHEPWLWRTERSQDDALQARCYEAVFRTFWNEPWFAGTFWWKWFPHGVAGRSGQAGFTPQGKPAEDVMRRWYESGDAAG